MSNSRQLLVVLLKYPEPGTVKTRLAAGIGAARAAEVYRDLVAITLEAIGQWGRGRGREVWIYFDPPDGEEQVRQWLADGLRQWTVAMAWRPQPAGDLGVRLSAIFDEGFRFGYQRIIAIGTDCPEVTCGDFEAAGEALTRAEVAIGPTPDGGYYLIGLRRPVPAVFHGIPWSTAATFEATLRAAKSAGLSVELLSPRADVDTEADWRSWLERSMRSRSEKTT